MKKVKFCCLLLSSIIIAVFLSCGAQGESGEEGFPDFEKSAARGDVYEAEVPLEEEMYKEEMIASEAPSVPQETVREPEERKRVFSGYAQISVNDVEEEKGRAAEIAEKAGGYVESVYENTIVVRVPAEMFREVFQAVQDLGEVLDSYEETVDVTDYFQDLETRLTIAVTTRERLYRLLEKTDDVEERLKILREIRRLTEEIERINRSLEILKKHISFSRITAQFVPRIDQLSLENRSIPFTWIAELNPLYPSIFSLKGSVEISLGDDFALFPREEYFSAESADQVRVRAGSIDNEPRGSSEFWQKALKYHLEPYYAQAEVKDLGSVRGVLFISKDIIPYYYFAGCIAEGKRCYVIEVFFPDEERFSERNEAVFSSITDMRVGS